MGEKAKKLSELIRKYEIPAKDPQYFFKGMWPGFNPGWYYQPEAQLGEWVFLGETYEEAREYILDKYERNLW